MPEPLREQVLEQVATILRGMTGRRAAFRGAYPADPVVERVYQEPDQVNRFPHLIVREAGGSSWRDIAATGHFEDAFRVLVYGYVQATPGVTASTWLQRLLWDLKLTLATETTLQGLKSDDGQVRTISFEETSEITDEGLLEPAGGRAAFAFEFGVLIDEHLAVP